MHYSGIHHFDKRHAVQIVLLHLAEQNLMNFAIIVISIWISQFSQISVWCNIAIFWWTSLMSLSFAVKLANEVMLLMHLSKVSLYDSREDMKLCMACKLSYLIAAKSCVSVTEIAGLSTTMLCSHSTSNIHLVAFLWPRPHPNLQAVVLSPWQWLLDTYRTK